MALVHNVFRAQKTREMREVEAGDVLAAYCPPTWRRDPGLRAVVDGKVHPRDELERRRLRAGGHAVFYVLPKGIELATGILISLLVSGLTTAVSYAIASTISPGGRSLEQSAEQNPTYGFDGRFSTTRPGTRIPKIYGRLRTGGHIIQQFVRPARDTAAGESDPLSGELNTLLGIATGPIAAIKDLRINGNPKDNFQGVSTEYRLGTVEQGGLRGFEDVVTSNFQDREITQAGGAELFTTSSEVDRIDLQFRFPGGLYTTTSSGGFAPKTVTIRIEYRELGLTAWKLVTKRVTARSANAFDAFWESAALDRAVYQLRITRLTSDDTTATGFSRFSLLTINEVLDETLNYPRLAMAAIRQLPTNQVSGAAPNYDLLVDGSLVKVYSDVDNFVTAWTQNPAWILRDFLTNPFDGLGFAVTEDRIDLEAFLQWAAFCAEQVAHDEQGVLEDRFQCDILIDGSLSAIEYIRQITTIGLADFVIRGDKWSVNPKGPRTAVQFFSMGRIQRDSFQYEKISPIDTSNYFIGQYWDRDNDYQNDPLPREDPLLATQDNIVEKTINLLGCTRRSQANRLLNYFVLENRLSRRRISFEAGYEAIVVEAGEVIGFAHDTPGFGVSSIIRDVNETFSRVRLQRTVQIEAGKDYELTVYHGKEETIDVLTVTNPTGETDLLFVSGEWSFDPAPGLHCSFGERGESHVLYEVTSVEPGSAADRRLIKCKEYNEDVFGNDLTVLPPPSPSNIPDPEIIPPNPTNLRLAERQVFAQDGTLSTVLDIYFALPPVADVRAEIFLRRLESTYWESIGIVRTGYFVARDIESPGVAYEVSVVSLSASGNRRGAEQGVRETVITRGVVRQPDDVANFRADRTSGGLVFQWDPLDPVRNFDLDIYEIRQGDSWETSVLVGRTADTTLSTPFSARGTTTYLIRARNTSGNYSARVTAVIIQVTGRIGENVVLTRDEAALNWPGSKLGFEVNANELLFDVDSESVVRVVTPPNPIVFGALGPLGGAREATVQLVGIYTSPPFQVTSGNAVRCLISSELDALRIDTSAFWTSPDLAGETWTGEYGRTHSWVSEVIGQVIRVRIEMRFSTTGSNDGDFGPWQERAQGIESFVKWAQVRIIATITDPSFTVRIRQLKVYFDVPDIIDSGEAETNDLSSVTVDFNKSFNNPPEVVATIQNASVGDELIITNKTATGFDVIAKNAGGTQVVRTFSWTAAGF